MTWDAWVESPLQLVNAVEYSYSTSEAVRISVRTGVPTLDAAAEAVRSGLPAGVEIATGARSPWRSPVGRSRHVLAGDAYSGQLRAVAALGRIDQIVLVDDGAAMVVLAEQLATESPIARSVVNEGPMMRRLGAAMSRRIRALADEGALTIFTAYDHAPGVDALAARGARVLVNTYPWARSRPLRLDAELSGHIIVGAAMAADGLIDPHAYARWLATLAESGPVTYVPHRREDPQAVAAYAELAHVTIVRPALALEIVLAHSSEVTRVSTLPSSVVATLGRILPPTAVLDVAPVPDAWWTEAAGGAFRAMVRSIEESEWTR